MTMLNEREREIERSRRPKRQCGVAGCSESPEYVVSVEDPRPEGIDSAIAACRIHAEIKRRNNPDAKVKPL